MCEVTASHCLKAQNSTDMFKMDVILMQLSLCLITLLEILVFLAQGPMCLLKYSLCYHLICKSVMITSL